MKSYRPEEFFDDIRAALSPKSGLRRPQGLRRMGMNPHANGGLLLKDLQLPDFAELRCDRVEARRDHL